MADQFSLCLTEYKAQLANLINLPTPETTYFPAAEGREAGWQISEDDTTPLGGTDYAIVLKPGTFDQISQGSVQTNLWGVTTVLYMRYQQYEGLWEQFRLFRSAILDLRNTHPMAKHGINNQKFTANERAGYLLDDQNRYTNFVVQSLECTITQRRIQRRAF